MLKTVAALCLLLTGLAPAGAEEFKTMEVIPGIYTLVPEAGGANATFLVTGEGVIVIDTGAGPAAGEALKDAIRRITDQPVAYVINTHYHGENTLGNQVFRTVPIIAHQATANALLGDAGQRLIEQHQATHPDEKIQLTVPNITFQNGMGLRLGKYFLRLVHPPVSHTEGDLYIYIPSYRMIITGGLVNKGHIPDLSDAHIDGWIEALRIMEDLDAETIIPGHGPWGGKPTVTLMKHYLMELRRFVQDELQTGGALPDIQKKVAEKLRRKYGAWQNQERMDQNIERAFFEYLPK